MSRRGMNHVTYRDKSCHIYTWIVSHIHESWYRNHAVLSHACHTDPATRNRVFLGLYSFSLSSVRDNYILELCGMWHDTGLWWGVMCDVTCTYDVTRSPCEKPSFSQCQHTRPVLLYCSTLCWKSHTHTCTNTFTHLHTRIHTRYVSIPVEFYFDAVTCVGDHTHAHLHTHIHTHAMSAYPSGITVL